MKTTIKSILFTMVLALAFKAQALPLAEKEWTFLLFLNGHNNLSSFGDMNIKDMEKSGSTDQVNLVVEWGSASTKDNRRLLVEKSKDPSKVTSPTLMTKKNVDMGDYKQLVDFVKWGAENFPAKHYFVAVWNHGSGWHFQDMNKLGSSDFQTTDISYDDNTGNRITTEQLGLAMKEIKNILGRNVDIYGSDACLMQMIEVANEMKDSVDYFVGSQELEPGEGWPYAPFMKKWTATPTLTPSEVSVLLSKEYLASYNGGVYGRKSVTFSALDMSKLDQLNSSVAQLVNHLKGFDAASLKKIKSASNSTLDFYYSDYKDLGDFLKKLSSTATVKDSKLIDQVQNSLKSSILSTDNSSTYAAATGLSIWIPSSVTSDMTRYKQLEFNKQTAWADFLKVMLAQ